MVDQQRKCAAALSSLFYFILGGAGSPVFFSNFPLAAILILNLSLPSYLQYVQKA
jgi:hypothetical protein